MAKRKIKIVAVDDNYEDLQLQIQDNAIEPIPEPIQEVKAVKKRQAPIKKEKPVEQVKQEPIPEVKPVMKRQPSVKKVKPVKQVDEPVNEPIEEAEEVRQEQPVEPVEVIPDKRVRVQQLVECPDCNKMITPKSL